MQNLSHISPITHPHPPSTEDALMLINELLRRNDYVPRLIQAIHAISCPYEREAIARLLPKIWHKIEQKCDERTGYYDADGYWHLTWINIDCDMRQIIKQAIAEQQELEYSLQQPITITPTPLTTKQTSTMQPQQPTPTERPTVTINNYFQAPIGTMISHVDKFDAHFDKDMNMHVQTLDGQLPSTPPAFSSYLKRGANPLKSDEEVQQNFVNAARNGATALVEYLISPEGKLYFDVQNIKPSLFIKTVNQECGTDIKLKSYQTARNRKM